jgi:hypothetical protein
MRHHALHETEEGFQDAVVQLARLHGWLMYHTHDSRHSPEGFPDLVLVRPPDLLFVELKTATGTLTQAQKDWLCTLGDCPGVEVHVWRPSDWDVIETRFPRGRPRGRPRKVHGVPNAT